MKIFYFNYETENLFAEEDALVTSSEEVSEYVYELTEDNISYVGILLDSGAKYKIMSDSYDSYKIYQFDNTDSNYNLIDIGSWNKVQDFLSKIF